MGRPLRPGDHTSYGVPLLRRAFPLFPFAFAHPEDRPHFEQPYVPVAVRPVVLDPTGQTWEEPAPQMSFVGRQRVLDRDRLRPVGRTERDGTGLVQAGASELLARSEEHTSELQSPMYLVCRLLLEKKKR